MKLNTLKPAEGSKGRVKRVGRGPGRVAAKQRAVVITVQSHAQVTRKAGFEGGQMPIQRRLPKFGFHNPTRVEYKAINLSSLQAACENTISLLLILTQ